MYELANLVSRVTFGEEQRVVNLSHHDFLQLALKISSNSLDLDGNLAKTITRKKKALMPHPHN
jgi:hypothetical protein